MLFERGRVEDLEEYITQVPMILPYLMSSTTPYISFLPSLLKSPQTYVSRSIGAQAFNSNNRASISCFVEKHAKGLVEMHTETIFFAYRSIL